MVTVKCPECGYQGPHGVVKDDDPERHIVTVECAACHVHFNAEVD